jgi:hypothetical protein
MDYKKSIDGLSSAVTEIFGKLESDAKLISNVLLYKKADLNPNAWELYQRENLVKLKLELNKLTQEALPKLENALEKAIVLNYKMVNGQFNLSRELKTLKELKQVEVIVPSVIFDRVNYYKQLAKQSVEGLYASIVQNHLLAITQIKQLNLKKTPTLKPLYEKIKQVTEQGITQQPKVTLRNGSQMGFKSYIEMSVRTGLQNDSQKLQELVGKKVGVVFYLASSHRDSADDHAEHQGKIYYNEGWPSFVKPEMKAEVEAFIQKNDIKSYQWVTSKPVFLSTRPNCRHNFMPITVQQALNTSAGQLLTKLNMEKGKYDKEVYDASQKQRYNERNIRKYKDVARLKEEQFKLAKTEEEKNDLSTSLKRANMLVRKWQGEQRTLVSRYKDMLFREYEREDNAVIFRDLGVKYDIRRAASQ